jgi:hypothetical protein
VRGHRGQSLYGRHPGETRIDRISGVVPPRPRVLNGQTFPGVLGLTSTKLQGCLVRIAHLNSPQTGGNEHAQACSDVAHRRWGFVRCRTVNRSPGAMERIVGVLSLPANRAEGGAQADPVGGISRAMWPARTTLRRTKASRGGPEGGSRDGSVWAAGRLKRFDAGESQLPMGDVWP